MTTAKFKQTADQELINKLIDKNPELKEEHVEFILWIEECFLLNGKLPSFDEASLNIEISEKDWSAYWRNNSVRNCLITRGVPLRHPGNPVLDSKEIEEAPLTFRQLEVLKALYDPNDLRPDHTKLKKLGVKTQEYNMWRKDPVFLKKAHQLASNLIRDNDDDAYRAFMDNIRSGDNQAIKLYFEMKGIYRPNDQSLMSFQTLVQQIIDIITREVTDAETLQRISGHIFMAINQQTVKNPNFIEKSTPSREFEVSPPVGKDEIVPSNSIPSSSIPSNYKALEPGEVDF